MGVPFLPSLIDTARTSSRTPQQEDAMEYIDIRIPVTIANDLADCIEVGVEGAHEEHYTDELHEAISILAGDIRIAAGLKIESITATYNKLMAKS